MTLRRTPETAMTAAARRCKPGERVYGLRTARGERFVTTKSKQAAMRILIALVGLSVRRVSDREIREALRRNGA